jgi:hypothetical protein
MGQEVGIRLDSIIGPAGGDGSMQAVGKADNEVRGRTPTDTQALHLLAA